MISVLSAYIVTFLMKENYSEKPETESTHFMVCVVVSSRCEMITSDSIPVWWSFPSFLNRNEATICRCLWRHSSNASVQLGA